MAITIWDDAKPTVCEVCGQPAVVAVRTELGNYNAPPTPFKWRCPTHSPFPEVEEATYRISSADPLFPLPGEATEEDDEVEELRAEVERLRAALVKLLVPEPMIAQSDSSLICFWCSADEYHEHYPDCAWVKAKALLEG